MKSTKIAGVASFSLRLFTLSNACIALTLFLILIAGCESDRSKQQAGDSPSEGEVRYVAQNPSDYPWPMFMYDISYLGISRDRILRPPLTLVWRFKTGGPVSSSPVVAKETVYIGSEDHRIYALHTRKWGVKWEFEAGDKIITAPTVYKDTVYFSARDNKVYALNAHSGEKKWEFQVNGWINSPIVAFQDKIYFGVYNDDIYVLNPETGEKILLSYSSIKIGDVTYLSGMGKFYPIKGYEHAEKWRDSLTLSRSWPATANGIVYIGARDNKLHAFDYESHKEIWSFETDGWVDSSAAIANGMLYFGSHDGYVYAFANASDTAPQKGYDPGEKKGFVTHDRAGVYSQASDSSEIIAYLNEGSQLPIADKKVNWYQVLLPDGRVGWMNTLDFIAARWSEDLQINDDIVKSVERMNLPQRAEMPSWSPDGRTIVFFDDISHYSLDWAAQSLWLKSGSAGDPKWVAEGTFINHRTSWADNGTWFAFEDSSGENRHRIWIVKNNATGLRQITQGEAPALSPGGDKVAFIQRSELATALWLYSLKDGTQLKLAEIPIKGKESYVSHSYIKTLELPAWSPDGSYLALGLNAYHYPDRYSRIAVISASGGLLRTIVSQAERVKEISWSPGGGSIGYITEAHLDRGATDLMDKKVHINVNGQSAEQVFDYSEGIAWSPDGKYMAFIEENDCMGMKKKVWLLDMKNMKRIQLLASKEKIHRIAWFNDGRIGLLTQSNPSKAVPATRGWILSIGRLTRKIA